MTNIILALILAITFFLTEQTDKPVRYSVSDAYYEGGLLVSKVSLENVTKASQTVRVTYYRVATKQGVQRVYDDGQRITLLPGQAETIFILLDHPHKAQRVQLSFLIIGKKGHSGYLWASVK